MKMTLGIIAAVVLMTILSAPAKAETITFVANMTGAQSIPSNSSPS